MIHSGVAACVAVVSVQVCLLNIKKLSSPSVLAIAKYNICSKIRVVGYPKMTKFGETAYFVVTGHWCSDMFIGYKKVSSPNV